MKTIHKYPLRIDPSYNAQLIPVMLPAGSTVLSVANQREEVVLYALVDPSQPETSMPVYVFGTGANVDMPMSARFVGTVSVENGALMWHVFVQGVVA